jgi:hypothetical protein
MASTSNAKEAFIKALKTLFGYCKNKKQWEVSFNDPPYNKLLELAGEYYDSLDIWSYDLFEHFYEKEVYAIQNKSVLSDTDAETFIDVIEKHLRNQLEDVYYVIPIRGARIKQTVVIGDVIILQTQTEDFFPATRPLNDILNEISKVTAIDKKKLEDHIVHVQTHNSKDFLGAPLLIIKIHGQFASIGTIGYALFIINTYFTFLRILCSKNAAKEYYLGKTVTNSNHMFCVGKNSNNFMPFPANDRNILYYELDFLHDVANQKIFENFVALHKSKIQDSLRAAFFRSMKFFAWGLKGSAHSNDDIALRLLFTTISAETLLLMGSTRGERKGKLANIMIGLNAIPESDQEQYSNAIIEAYKDRSGLVHAGAQDFLKYSYDIITDSVESKSLSLMSKMQVNIITSFPTYYNRIASTTNHDKYLEEWVKDLKSFTKEQKYNLYQRIILWAIQVLSKSAKLPAH